jgi:hypothetical protein
MERLAEGTYMWGTKKIFAKIMNNRLIIRVGGGFMNIDEFIKNMENELRATNQLYIFEVDGQSMTLEQAVRSSTPPRSKNSAFSLN